MNKYKRIWPGEYNSDVRTPSNMLPSNICPAPTSIGQAGPGAATHWLLPRVKPSNGGST